MKKESILYGVIGLLVGIVLTGITASYAVNNNQNGMMSMMGMNSNRTMSGDMDRTFIEQMIPHHESAIEMAKLAQQKTARPEIKTLAGNIITSQTAEINSMKQWYKDWYGSAAPIQTGADHGMNTHGSKDDLSNATNFDEAFLAEMITHHQIAVIMTNMLDGSTKRPEMEKLAKDINTAQSKEISDMKSWQQQWGYKTTSNTDSNNMMNMGH